MALQDPLLSCAAAEGEGGSLRVTNFNIKHEI